MDWKICEGSGVSTISKKCIFVSLVRTLPRRFRMRRHLSLVNPATLWALSIQSKLSKIWKQRQMGQKFPGKVSRNSQNSWTSEMRTIQPKLLEIPGAKLNGKKTSGKKFPKIWGYLARLSGSIWKSWKMLFHPLLEVAEIQIVLFGWIESAL